MTVDFTNIMKDKTDYFSKEEITSIINYCYDIREHFIKKGKNHLAEVWLRNYALFLTLFRTGRRISEVVGQKPFITSTGLRPIDFSHGDNLVEFTILKKNQIKKTNKKGKPINEEILIKERWNKEHKRALIPVDKEYYSFMKDLIETLKIPSHLRIFKITRQRADTILKEIAFKLNIVRPNKKIHCHMFRHSYAVHFLKGNSRNPMALIQLKDLLKHSKMDITTTYTQFTPEDKLDSLERAFGGE